MPFVFVLIIDICIAMFLIGIVNVLWFDAPGIILLIPLLIIAIVLVIWLVRKIPLWCERREKDNKKPRD